MKACEDTFGVNLKTRVLNSLELFQHLPIRFIVLNTAALSPLLCRNFFRLLGLFLRQAPPGQTEVDQEKSDGREKDAQGEESLQNEQNQKLSRFGEGNKPSQKGEGETEERGEFVAEQTDVREETGVGPAAEEQHEVAQLHDQQTVYNCVE